MSLICRFAQCALLAAVCRQSLLADSSAVIPFANRATEPDAASANASLDWIGESIAETVRDAIELRGGVSLSRLEVDHMMTHLNLRPRTVLTQASALKLGEELDTEQVVYGTFAFAPDKASVISTQTDKASDTQAQQTVQDNKPKPPGPLRGSLQITARVFDRRKFTQSAVFSESGNLEDLPSLEAHLAWRTLALLAPSLAPPEADFRSLRPAVRLDAEENYTRGLMAREASQQERFFLQAARLDPNFGHAAYALGRIHYDRKDYKQAAQWLQKVAPTDVHAHDAQFLLGLALYQSSDYAGAQMAFQSIAATVPLSEVWNNLGAALSRRKMAPQAVEAFTHARDGDPHDPDYHFNLGYALWHKGDYAAAADSFRAALDRQPEDEITTLLLGMCLRKQGPRAGDAQLEALERLKTNYEERAYRQLKTLVGLPGK